MSNLSQTQSQDLKKQLHQIMEDIYPDSLPGASLLVIKDDKIIINEGFGLADLESKRKVTPATNFRMASVSKQFTAMCILLLYDRHKISLDDPITKYLNGLPSFAANVTIKNLLTHSSGLQDYESLIPPERTTQVTDADVLELVGHTDSLYFTPGTQFRYSNTGFCILTQIVEQISGIPYENFISANIFKPLEMLATMMYKKGENIPERAYGYHQKNDQWNFADQSITSATLGDGCVYTSLNDYQKWISALWDQKLFRFNKNSNPLLPHVSISKKMDYGFGWFTSIEADGTRSDFHSGESTGFHNIVYQNPEKKTLIVIFSNSDDERIATAFDKAADTMQIKLILGKKNESLFDYLSKIYE